MADVKTILDGLAAAEQIVSFGAKIGADIEPFVTGIIRGVTKLVNKDGSIDYIVVLGTGGQELDQATANYDEAIARVNAALVAAGKQPLSTE